MSDAILNILDRHTQQISNLQHELQLEAQVRGAFQSSIQGSGKDQPGMIQQLVARIEMLESKLNSIEQKEPTDGRLENLSPGEPGQPDGN